jgi:hypothetical protein
MYGGAKSAPEADFNKKQIYGSINGEALQLLYSILLAILKNEPITSNYKRDETDQRVILY